jgi:hypothetical protein
MDNQVKELKRADDAAIDAQSPLIYVYGVSLVHHMPVRPPEEPIPDGDKISLWNNRTEKNDSCVAVEFENFGNRAAIVYGMDIESSVLNKDEVLRQNPDYSSHPREYSDGIRPSGAPKPVPEPIVDDHQMLRLTKDEVAAITAAQKRLWVYGIVHLKIFPDRFEDDGFCLRWYGSKDGEGFSSKGCPDNYLARTSPQERVSIHDWFDDPTRRAEDRHCPGNPKDKKRTKNPT